MIPDNDEASKALEAATGPLKKQLGERLIELLSSDERVSVAYPNPRIRGTEINHTYVALRFPPKDHKAGIVVFTEEDEAITAPDDVRHMYHMSVVIVDTKDHTSIDANFNHPFIGMLGRVLKQPIGNWDEWQKGSRVEFVPKPTSMQQQDLIHIWQHPQELVSLVALMGRAQVYGTQTRELFTRFITEHQGANKPLASSTNIVDGARRGRLLS